MTPNNPVINRILPYLDVLEKVMFAALLTGAILYYLKVTDTLLNISLLGTAVVFFLSAFRVADMPQEEGKLFGFSELLAWQIIPKVLWIGGVVILVGIWLYMSGAV